MLSSLYRCLVLMALALAGNAACPAAAQSAPAHTFAANGTQFLLDGKPFRIISGRWEMFSLPMNDLTHLRTMPGSCSGPCLYVNSMRVSRPADTFLDTSRLHKGQLWLGEHNLGRFWQIGPQHTLYTPAPWMHAGANQIVFFDLFGDGSESVTSITRPVPGRVVHTREKQ